MKQKESSTARSQEILDLLSEYSKALSLLEQYDAGTLTEPKGAKAKFVLKYEDCVKIIKNVRVELIGKEKGLNRAESSVGRTDSIKESVLGGSLFGSERSKMLEGIIKNLYQTFNKKELYNTVEEKAAHLLYLIIKDHPFSDGNKRLAAFLFVYFLYKNNYLYYINNNTLIALALLIAESDPKEKDVMVKIIMNILSGR